MLVGACFILGLLVGSFLNVVVLRLPKRMEYSWRCQCRELLDLDSADEVAEPPGIVRTSSHCRHCGSPIKPWHNIPLISFVVLRGRCSACDEKISIRYPLIELLTGLLTAWVVWHFGPTPQAAAAIVFSWILIAAAGIDIDTQLLPDTLTLPLLWLGLILSLMPVFAGPSDAIIGARAGYLILWLVYHGFRLLTGKEGMGYGDFKLLAALGAWMGWQMLPLIIILASVAGAVIGIAVLMASGSDRNRPLPFGPYLAIAGWIALLWGNDINQADLALSGL